MLDRARLLSLCLLVPLAGAAPAARAQEPPPRGPEAPAPAPPPEPAVDVVLRLLREARASGELARLQAERHFLLAESSAGIVLASVRLRDVDEGLEVSLRVNAAEGARRFELVTIHLLDRNGILHISRRATSENKPGGYEAHREGEAIRTLGSKPREIAAGRDLLPWGFALFVLPRLLACEGAPTTLSFRLVEDDDSLEAERGFVLHAAPAEGGLLRVRITRPEKDPKLVVADALVRTHGERRGELASLVLDDDPCRPISPSDARKLQERFFEPAPADKSD